MWKNIIKHYLKDKRGELYANCTFDIDEQDTALPPFYKTCLRAWKKFLNELKYRCSPQTQFLWNNKNIKVQGKSFFYKGFMRVGIWNVFYLYRNSQIIPFVFWKRKGLRQDRYIAWRDLLAAIPHGYKEIIQDGNIPLEDTALKINSQKPFTEAKRRFL